MSHVEVGGEVAIQLATAVNCTSERVTACHSHTIGLLHCCVFPFVSVVSVRLAVSCSCTLGCSWWVVQAVA